jgi:hypothetical protein
MKSVILKDLGESSAMERAQCRPPQRLASERAIPKASAERGVQCCPLQRSVRLYAQSYLSTEISEEVQSPQFPASHAELSEERT